MKALVLIQMVLYVSLNFSLAQDTFSIVAVDSITGEVGSAGASCVDLFQTGFQTDHFLGQLIPGIGAINTQAWYLAANQNNATNRMNLGDTPSQIIQWLITNDSQSQPELRQYGIVAMINGSPQTAAHTGSSTNNYKNHIIGPNYSIQGNILLDQEVLDSMEARFLNENGDLACKLMAALQGANRIGADTRCATNGTSSLFAFVKVAQPTDVFGSPSFVASVRTSNNAGIEPIDSLQSKFNSERQCENVSRLESNKLEEILTIAPNPANEYIILEMKYDSQKQYTYELCNLNGQTLLKASFNSSAKVDVSQLSAGMYLIRIETDGKTYMKKLVID